MVAFVLESKRILVGIQIFIHGDNSILHHAMEFSLTYIILEIG